jgi:hypothetical protein
MAFAQVVSSSLSELISHAQVLPVLVLAAAMQDDEVSDLRISAESHLSPFLE